MIKFYVTRLSALTTPEERENYLNNTVAASLRDEVKAAYNEAHPETPID